MKKTTQNGFSAVVILLAIIAVSLVCFTGYYVYNTQQSKNKQVATPVTTKQNTTTPASTSVAYLNVPEFGVKIKLTANIADAYYAIRSTDPTIADLSLHSLTKIDPQCSPTDTSTAALTYYTDPSAVDPDIPAGSQTYGEVLPNAPKISGKYFYIVLGNGSCGGDQKIGDKITQIREDFAHAEITAL